MVIRFKKKMRGQRGSGNHGWGHKKKHRGGGSRGGRGFAGYHKHKFSYTVTKDPDRYGKKGFPGQKKEEIINVGDLEKIGETEINLTKMGYGKLLSKGSVNRPFFVTIKQATEKAKQKITAAGGKILGEEMKKTKEKKQVAEKEE